MFVALATSLKAPSSKNWILEKSASEDEVDWIKTPPRDVAGVDAIDIEYGPYELRLVKVFSNTEI